jgi:hypothetical protein
MERATGDASSNDPFPFSPEHSSTTPQQLVRFTAEPAFANAWLPRRVSAQAQGSLAGASLLSSGSLATTLYEVTGEASRHFAGIAMAQSIDVDESGRPALSGDCGSEVTRALRDAVEGRFVEAAERLVELPMDVQDAPLVRRLLDRIGRCLDVGGDFVFTVVQREAPRWNVF